MYKQYNNVEFYIYRMRKQIIYDIVMKTDNYGTIITLKILNNIVHIV